MNDVSFLNNPIITKDSNFISIMILFYPFSFFVFNNFPIKFYLLITHVLPISGGINIDTQKHFISTGGY